jgi:DNA ligase-1
MRSKELLKRESSNSNQKNEEVRGSIKLAPMGRETTVAMETSFQAFAELCRALEETRKRNEKIEKLTGFLRGLNQDEIRAAVRMISGRVFSDADERVLEVSGATLWKILRKQKQRQTLLLTRPLTISEVNRSFSEIAAITGARSRNRKESILEGLFGRANQLEAEYLTRILHGEMRIGVVEGVVLDAIAKSADTNEGLVRRALMMLGDIGEVAYLALTGGDKALEHVGIVLFRPVRLMMAEMAEDISEVLNEHKSGTAFEFKFDGARIQIHKKSEEVRIFSRRLTDVTESLPDVVEAVKRKIRVNDALIDGEAVAIGSGMKPLPFQELMRRFRREHDIAKAAQEIPLRLYLFDILYLNGGQLVDLTYEERWRLLSGICPQELMAERLVTKDQNEIQAFLTKALNAGHEGLMAKALGSPYLLGSRGKNWFKIKPADRFDLVIVAAEWGYGRRSEWLSNYHLAVRDEATGDYLDVGKTFKGLTDNEFKWMTERLQELKISEDRYTVRVRPTIVVEVAYNEIQKSPHYNSGFALRFARITRIREDKRPEETDTMEKMRILYEKQFEHKGKIDEALR